MKIFLIGLMGTGKSYWAKKLAKKLKIGGYDLDYLVESHEEKSIAEIFAEEGEDHFRKAESKMLRWFGEKKTFVLATGGGTPVYHENMIWMNKNGITIWIDESIETLAKRLMSEQAHRPAIHGLPYEGICEFLRQKRSERLAFYQQAQHHLSGDDINERNFAKILKEHA